MKFSRRRWIFAILSIVLAASVLVIWLVLCPKYEATAVGERTAEIRRLQVYAVENLDRTITDWSHDAEIIASQVAERPKEGEAVLRAMMALRPGIIQVRIRSVNQSDELVSQNTVYPVVNAQIADSAWFSSKQDSLQRYAWLSRTEPPKQVFVVRRHFSIQNLPFVLTVFWDAKRFNELFAEIPLGREYPASIVSPTAVLVHDTSASLNLEEMLEAADRAKEVQSTREEETSRQVLTRPFPSAQLWLVIAVPGKAVTGPIKELMLYTTSLAIGLTVVLLALGWLLARRARRPAHKHEPESDSDGNR
jgi:hypothetical protein